MFQKVNPGNVLLFRKILSPRKSLFQHETKIEMNSESLCKPNKIFWIIDGIQNRISKKGLNNNSTVRQSKFAWNVYEI